MRERGHLREWPTFALVFVVLVVGHFLSYLVAIPDPARRATVLAHSGHGYLHLASEVAVILGCAAVVTIGLRALSRRERTVPSSRAHPAWRLGALQAGAFVTMELGERIISRGGVGELFTDHILGIGIVAQLGLGAIGLLLLRWIGRAAVRLADVLARPPRPQPAGVDWVRSTASRRPRLAFAGSVSARAPPFP